MELTLIQDEVARLVTKAGATRLYFHAATNATSGLPTSKQSAAKYSDLDIDAQTVNRSMNTTIGTSQTSLSGSPGTYNLLDIYFTKFVSTPITVSTINANTWTYNFSTKQSSTAVNFPVDTGNAVHVNLYVWRPTTQEKKGTIRDSFTSVTVYEPPANSQRVHHCTFTGDAVSLLTPGTDVLVFEVWFKINPAIGGESGTFNYYYDGTTRNTTNNAVVSNHASYLETPQSII